MLSMGKRWVDLSGLLALSPAVDLAPQTDCRLRAPRYLQTTFKQGYRFPHPKRERSKAALGKGPRQRLSEMRWSSSITRIYKLVIHNAPYFPAAQPEKTSKQKTGVRSDRNVINK